jgi:hypothetical protein
MSPSRWRALRALRVVLACLALWLPVSTAAASFGPVDAVVMIAGAGRGVDVSPVDGDHDRKASQHRATSASFSVATTDDVFLRWVRPQTAEQRARTPRRYLLHCALLR